MQEVTQFQFQTQSVRVVLTKSEKPFWVAKDVCKILGYANHKDVVKRLCREKGVWKTSLLTAGGDQTVTCIDEGNLYRLIIKSNKPQSKPFESWVCDEVLPAIRKDGRYEILNPVSSPLNLTPEKLAEIGYASKHAAMITKSFGYYYDKRLSRQLVNSIVEAATGVNILEDFHKTGLLPEETLNTGSQTMLDFLLQHCELTPHGQISKTVLYKLYQNFCREQHITPLFDNHFARELYNNPGVGKTRPLIGGVRVACFSGITIRQSEVTS